jgi:hypothetical protein
MPKRRKKKGTDAWKSLVRMHKKGPKRIKIAVPRSKDGVSPLTMSEHTKRVQIVVSGDFGIPRKIGVVVFKQAYIDMGLTHKTVQKMTIVKMTRAGQLLRKTLDIFKHNDFILGHIREIKLDNCIGRCIVMTGKIVKPDIYLHIDLSTVETTVTKSTKNVGPHCGKQHPDVDIEYM